MKKYSIITYGCQMNHSDSERIESILEEIGFQKARDQELADLYILNTCSVRQKAEDKVLGLGKKFIPLKKKNENLKIILTGCMAKRDNRQNSIKKDEYQEKHISFLKEKMPWVDFILEIEKIHKIPELLGYNTKPDIKEYLSIKPKYNSKFQAFVPISTGCNKFCTFCIVPFTRGEEKYRPFEEIYSEVKNLIENGYKEITLLGQNVNSWKSSTKGHLKIPIPKYRNKKLVDKDHMNFADLLEKIASIKGDFWIRFTSSHPYDIDLKLIKIIAKFPTLAKQIHFALQSGSNSVLKRMNRYYTVEEFKEKVYKIKEAIPNVAITTDIIVGFCGETDQEFFDTVKICEEIRFDQIYISEYSQRKGTIAAKFYKDDVPKEIKKKRKEILEEILKKGLMKNNKKYLNIIDKVLIEKKDRNDNVYYGKNTQGKNIKIYSKSSDINLGEFYNVKITNVKEFIFEGYIYENSSRS